MNAAEFETWWEFHRTRDPKFFAWSKGLSRGERDRLKTSYRFQIGDLPYRLARDCSKRMLNRGDFEDGPRGFERHGEILADLAPILAQESFRAVNRDPRAEERERDRGRRAEWETKFGSILDAMDLSEVLELAGGIKDLGSRISVRRLLSMDRFPKGQKNQMVRPALLKVLAERETPPDLFASMDLGATPDFGAMAVKMNDQWE